MISHTEAISPNLLGHSYPNHIMFNLICKIKLNLITLITFFVKEFKDVLRNLLELFVERFELMFR